MRTMIEIADTLLAEAKELAAREQTTLRALVEQGLRQVVRQKQVSKTFRLCKASFCGHGLQLGLQESDWATIRKLAYEESSTIR